MSTVDPPEPDPTTTPAPPPVTVPPRRTWTTGATASLLLGIAMTLSAAALLIGAGAAYLDDVDHSTVVEIDDSSPENEHRLGGALTLAPTDVDIWTAQASGTDTTELDWTPSNGVWTVVVMNRNGANAVHVTTDLDATVPILETVQSWTVVGGLLTGALGVGLVAGTTLHTQPRRSFAAQHQMLER